MDYKVVIIMTQESQLREMLRGACKKTKNTNPMWSHTETMELQFLIKVALENKFNYKSLCKQYSVNIVSVAWSIADIIRIAPPLHLQMEHEVAGKFQ